MAGFLRKKSKNRQQEPVLISAPSNLAPTPIFAKLASSSNSPEQQSRHAPKVPSQGRVVVSQPMALGSAYRSTTSGGDINRQVPRKVETQGTRVGAPLYPSASKGNSSNNAYIHEPNVMAVQSARSPSTNGKPSPQQQADRNVLRFPVIDKPLPILIPTDDEPSPANVSNVPPVDPTPLLNRRPLPQPRTGLQTSFHGARAELVQAGMSTAAGGQRVNGDHSASNPEEEPPKLLPKDVPSQSVPLLVQQPHVRDTNDSVRGSVIASVGDQHFPSASRQDKSLPRGVVAHASPPLDQERPVKRLANDVVQKVGEQSSPGASSASNQDAFIAKPALNWPSSQLSPTSVQQPLVRRVTNDVVQSHSPHSQNSTSPRPLRPGGEPLSLLSADFADKSPPLTGNSQPYAKQLNDSPQFSKPATVNGPTASDDRLRKDVTVPESVLVMRGDFSPPSSQRYLYQKAVPVITNSTGLGGVAYRSGGDDTKGTRPLPGRPKSPSEFSDGDDLFVDAFEEPKQTAPLLEARQLPAELSPYRNRLSSSPPDASGPGQIIGNQASSVSRPPPQQGRDIESVSRAVDNMGVNVSFPEEQHPLSASNMFKTGPRKIHLPSSPAEGLKMRGINQTMGLHQQLDPYQEFNRMPPATANNGPTRGKPLIFAAMEANIDRPHLGEEQRVSVRLWDGQDRSFGQTMTGYPSPPSSTAADQTRSTTPANSSLKDAHAAEYPSPPSSEFAYPRGTVEAYQELLHASGNVSGVVLGKPRKLSKARQPSDDGHKLFQRNAGTRPITPVKARPLTPVSPPQTSKKTTTASEKSELQVPSSRQALRSSGMALLGVDEDPFAKIEGVKMLAPVAKEKEKIQEKDIGTRGTKARNAESSEEGPEETDIRLKKHYSIPSIPSIETDGEDASIANSVQADAKPEKSSKYAKKWISRAEESEAVTKNDALPLLKPSEAAGGIAHSKNDVDTLDTDSGKSIPSVKHRDQLPLFGLWELVSNVRLLSELLTYLSFYDWCILAGVSKRVQTLLSENDDLREAILERFLKTVGYTRWCWDGPDPLPLSLQDLNDYMFGVSTPTHEYARVANLYVKSLGFHAPERDPLIDTTIQRLTAATRAYSQVVLRLRVQAEKDAASRVCQFPAKGAHSHPPSRASSPHSTFSHGHSQHGNIHQLNGGASNPGFKSPLFCPKRAPLLRVFVPSPDGDWLSDKSLLECEAECQRAGLTKLMRLGDVVWDVAVGDEGNVGRLVWDGSYLIDLDYSYSPVGDLPKYIPSLAFPPSYFHKVIRTGPGYSNPIAHIDLRPWGEQVAANLQLLQDRVRTETPQGVFHNVVRWVHRSSFIVRPQSNTVRMVGSPPSLDRQNRIHIPDTNGLFVDPGWYGTIVVETEGTNELLADLQDRCGPGVFPPRAQGVAGKMGINPHADSRKVFRVLREKSRPGEIWLKAVSIKEKLL